jgi:hypothetical protein
MYQNIPEYLCHPSKDDVIAAQHVRLHHYDTICSISITNTFTHICYLVLYKPVLTVICITSFLPSLPSSTRDSSRDSDSQRVSSYLGLSCAHAVPRFVTLDKVVRLSILVSPICKDCFYFIFFIPINQIGWWSCFCIPM